MKKRQSKTKAGKNIVKKRIAHILLPAALFAAFLPLLLSVAGCRTDSAPKSRTVFGYFDTGATFYDYSGADDATADARFTLAQSLLERYHRYYDIYNEYDGLVNAATLNRRAGEKLTVEEDLFDLLSYAKGKYAETEGKVNIAMGAVLSLWHDARENAEKDPENATRPTPDALAEAREHCRIDDLILDRQTLTVRLADPQMRLDLGAVAKGYATEKIAQELLSAGVTSFALDIGGNLRILGTKPDGSGFVTGVRNPDTSSSDRYIYTATLSDTALSTSGAYERVFTADGVRYGHIIDPATCEPPRLYASVTVVSPSAADADVYSTALFCTERAGIDRFVAAHPEVFLVIVYDDGTAETLGNRP